MLFSVWHVSHYHPEIGTFGEVFRQAMADLATGNELALFLSLSMPAGSILLVVVRAVVAAIAGTILRLGPHAKNDKLGENVPDPNTNVSDSDPSGDGLVNCSPLPA